MKIEIPSFAKDLQDEGTIVLLAFLFRMAKKPDGGFKGTRYHIHVQDARRILGAYTITPHNVFKDVQPYIRIGSSSDKTWMIDWKVNPHTSEYEIEKPYYTSIWGYLVASDTFRNLLEADGNVAELDRSQPVLSREDIRNFAYSNGNAQVKAETYEATRDYKLTKLTDDQIENILQLRKQGVAYNKISTQTGVSYNVVWRVVHGTYKKTR